MEGKELLTAISEIMDEKLQPIKADISELKEDVSGLKTDVALLKEDVSDLKTDVALLKEDVSVLDRKIVAINLHLENNTDRNISILAENHLTLIDKLNHAVRAADKDLVYDVKMNYLIDNVKKLNEEMAEVQSRIA